MDKKPYNSSSSSSSQDPEVRKGPWTMEEDLILINYIANHGEGVWNSLAKAAGLKRTGKSCRLRWLNYLRPDVRRGNITPEEQLLIMELHSKWGNRWSKIAKHLPGRTDNEIKNYWRTRIQKHIKQAESSCSQSQQHQQHAQLSSETADHQQASSSHVSNTMADSQPMDTYSPSSFNHQAALADHQPFPTNPFPTVLDQSSFNYWSMDDLWPNMQILNGD